MAYVGETYRIHYIAKNFTKDLTDVRMVVYKPTGVKQGVYVLTELNAGDGKGIYYFDYEDSDIQGTYLFVINSVSCDKKDARQVFFEQRSGWGIEEKMQIRDALGINGDKILSSGGQLQSIQTKVNEIKDQNTILIADVSFIKSIEGGKWKIFPNSNEMIFYKDDNATEIARFKLYDENGIPSVASPFERVRL